jgi:2-keto-4-pentenoate hydratase/2-oxohepta-3-ene-1,7-dioic acid hydratase in catechol pathway
MSKLARYEAHGEIAYGVVEGDVVKQLSGPPFGDYQVTDHTHALSEVKLLAPVVPGKVVAIGLNYKSHLGDREPPKVPEPFLKATTCVIGPGDTIVIPTQALIESEKIQEEAELSIVIGRHCKSATKANALSYVLGYTCGNDVSARNWQGNDLQWWRAKSSDTFGPIGPFIATDVDPGNLRITARVNGKTVQDSNTGDLLHDVPTIIEFVSRVMTLEAGDVIMTGTPGAPGDLRPGDTVEVEIEGIGVLTNPVTAE